MNFSTTPYFFLIIIFRPFPLKSKEKSAMVMIILETHTREKVLLVGL